MKNRAIRILMGALFALSLSSCNGETPSGSGSFPVSDSQTISQLKFELDSGGAYYKVSSAGGEFKNKGPLVIPSTYKGLPVKEIADRGFKSSAITSLYLPDTIVSIGKSAFEYCRDLTEVHFGSSLVTIDKNAFHICDSLKELVMPSSLRVIGESAFERCEALSSLELNNNLSSIDAFAFRGCSKLASLTVTENVTHIGSFAFDSCTSLKKVRLPFCVQSFGAGAFARCTSLKKFELVGGSSTKHLSVNEGILFDEDGTTILSFPAGLESVYGPDGTLYIGNGAYAGTKMEIIRIPSNVLAIGEYAFYACDDLKTVNFGNKVSIVGKSAFENCLFLESISLPSSIRTVGERAFHKCEGLISISFPDAPLSIGAYALEYCSSLRNVTMGKSVSSIGYRAFRYAESLVSISYQGTVEDWGSVTKNTNWCDSTLKTINCTDGSVSLGRTI